MLRSGAYRIYERDPFYLLLFDLLFPIFHSYVLKLSDVLVWKEIGKDLRILILSTYIPLYFVSQSECLLCFKIQLLCSPATPLQEFHDA